MSDGALADLRVLDVSQQIAGPYCGRLFAGLGAEVIKVEHPDGGDASRRDGPFADDGADLNGGGRFLYLNANKKGVTLNLQSEEGRAILRQLAGKADVLIESFTPGAMDDMGIGFDALRAEILERFDMSLGSGLGRIAGRVFRIGHLGDFNDLMLVGALSGVEMGLARQQVPHSPGGVQAAMDYLTGNA